jgi:hypothetical protein
VGAPKGGVGEGVEVAVEGTVFVTGALVGVGAVPLPREMGLATADTRMKMATRRKPALATKTTRAREEITADEGLRERLDMRACSDLDTHLYPKVHSCTFRCSCFDAVSRRTGP